MKDLYFDPKDFCGGEEIICFSSASKKHSPYVQIICAIIIGLLIIAFDGFLMGAEVMANIIEKAPKTKILLFLCCLAVHIIPLGVWAFYLMKNSIYESERYYLITEKKIMIIYNLPTVKTTIMPLDKCKILGYGKYYLIVSCNGEKVTMKGVILSEEGFEKLKEITEKVA